MSIAKITSKGQITIPVYIRKRLKTNLVSIEFKGDSVILRPVYNVGGSLSKYAFKNKSYDEIMELEEKAIEEGFSEGESKRNEFEFC